MVSAVVHRAVCLEAGEPVTIHMLVETLEIKCRQHFSISAVNTMVLKLVDKGYLASADKIHQAFRFKAVIMEEKFEFQEIERAKTSLLEGNSADYCLH